MATQHPAVRPDATRAATLRRLRWSAPLAASLLGLGACVAPWAQPRPPQPDTAQPDTAQPETAPPSGTGAPGAEATSPTLGDASSPTAAGASGSDVSGPDDFVTAGTTEASAATAAPYPHDDPRRLALAQTLAAEPGWNLYESASWFVATPVDDPLLVEGVKLRLEAVRSRLHSELTPRHATAHRAKPLVRIHASRAAFEDAGGQRGTSGFWNGPERTLVVYDAGTDRAETTWPALQHVAVHAYLDDELGLENVPPWFLYGVAARYESLVRRELRTGGLALLQPPPDVERARLASAVEDAPPMALGELLAFDRDEFFGAIAYGSGGFRNLVLAHAFVRFLEAPEAGTSPELDQQRAAYLAAAFRALQDGLGADVASRRARGVVPAAELDASWRAWIEAETGAPLPASR